MEQEIARKFDSDEPGLFSYLVNLNDEEDEEDLEIECEDTNITHYPRI